MGLGIIESIFGNPLLQKPVYGTTIIPGTPYLIMGIIRTPYTTIAKKATDAPTNIVLRLVHYSCFPAPIAKIGDCGGIEKVIGLSC